MYKTKRKQLIELLRGAIPPSYQFKGLCLDDEDFITFGDLIELEQLQTTEKYLLLRDIANSILAKEKWVETIEYSEKDEPKMKLIFSPNIVSSYSLVVDKEAKSNEQAYYVVTPQVLDYLLSGRAFNSEIDKMLVTQYKEELLLMKEGLENHTLYANYALLDAYANFRIDVLHKKYRAEHVEENYNPNNKPGAFVDLAYLKGGYIYEYNLVENKEIVSSDHPFIENETLPQSNVYLHKRLLPPHIQNRLKKDAK